MSTEIKSSVQYGNIMYKYLLRRECSTRVEDVNKRLKLDVRSLLKTGQKFGEFGLVWLGFSLNKASEVLMIK